MSSSMMRAEDQPFSTTLVGSVRKDRCREEDHEVRLFALHFGLLSWGRDIRS